MKAEYRLVYRGQSDPKALNKDVIIAHLQKQFDIGRIFELDELVDNPPFILKRSFNRDELEKDSHKLKTVGAETLIVRGNARSTSLSSHIERSLEAKQSSTVEGNFDDFFHSYVKNFFGVIKRINPQTVAELALELVAARSRRSQIIFLGNGGSAAAASHFATDLAKQRFEDEELLFRVLSLSDNLPLMTATANDFGYEHVFVQQLKNILQPKDLVVAISSSGNSKNILSAVQYARIKGAQTYAIVGFDGGALLSEADKAIHIPTKTGHYGFMEDATSVISHMLSIFLYEQDRERIARKK